MRPLAPDPVDLAPLGWDAGWSDALDAAVGHPAVGHPAGAGDTGGPACAGSGVPGWAGRVVRVDRGLCTVCTTSGRVRAGLGGDLLAWVAADATAAPVTGDWVRLRSWADDRTTAESVLPRRTALLRATPSRRSESQLLAANLTVAAVVIGLLPDPGIAKVERLLAVAWGSGALPLLVLTKADLVSDACELAAELGEQAPDVEVVVCSAVTGAGTARLRELVGESGTMGLLGSSGVGKSALVNALVGATVLTTRQIRADGRGRHTSARRELVLLPGGGSVVDTPGVRGVGLATGTSGAPGPSTGVDGLARTFDDIDELAAGCRFRDCRHDGEPGCAVAAALDDGRLTPRRVEAWRQLQRELAWMARRSDARLRARGSRAWRERDKASRESPRRQR